MESGVRESSGSVGSVLIPMRFVWPCGGRSVFISGSFNRWSRLLPMSPVEGCPTVFQTICSIPAGCHQYKFFVDGEWRHDEHQPYMTSEVGIVNTIFLTSDRNSISGTSSPNMSTRSMEVDNNGVVVHLPQVSGTTFIGAITVSETELMASRIRVSQLLSDHSAYELLPESGKVVALDINLPVKQAFHILYEQGISMAPLWDDSTGQCIGVLSAMDFILIFKELTARGSNLTEGELETHTISAWKEGKANLKRQIDEKCRAFSKPLIHAGPNDNLKDVALKILQNNVASVPVIHSSSKDGSFQQLLHMATLSGILKFICRYFRNCASSLPVLQLPIFAIPIGTWVPNIRDSNGRPLAILRPSTLLSSALDLFIQAQVSSLPVVDENDSLLDIYSRSDITALAKDRNYARICFKSITVHQALQLGQNSYSSVELSQRCQICLKSDSLHQVMERLANPGVRRLMIVEARTKRLEGIISLSDIFKFFLS